MKNTIISILLIIGLLATFAQAQVLIDWTGYESSISKDSIVTETNNKINGFSAVGYVCLDATCSKVGQQVWPIQSTSTSVLKNTLPTVLINKYGYGLYFYKEGYIPYEVWSNYYGTSLPNDPQQEKIYLGKKEICNAPIEDFSVINEVQPNVPLVIDMTAKLDAQTYAAIRNAGPLTYIPNELSTHYSVATKVTLKIYNKDNTLINTQTQNIVIPYSGSKKVSFTWTPTVAGNHKAVVETYVTDDKCLTSETQNAQKQFHVLADLPRNMCYTLLNNLKTSNQFPIQNEEVTIEVSKISNYADDNYQLTPIQTNVKVTIIAENTNTEVFNEEYNLPANTNVINPETYSTIWDASLPSGWYKVSVFAIGLDPICQNINNLAETQSIRVYLAKELPPEPQNQAPVLENLPDKYVDEDTTPANKWVDLYTYASDTETADNLLQYKIVSQSNADLISCKITDNRYVDCNTPATNQFGSSDIVIEVNDGEYSDRDMMKVTVNSVNDAPYINSIPSISVEVGDTITLTINANDVDNLKSELTLSYISIPAYALFLDNKDGTSTFAWTPESNQVGIHDITFKVTDPQGATGSKTVQITVKPKPIVNTAPKIIDWTPNDLNIERYFDTCESFEVIATDAQNDELTYIWNLNGDIVQGVDLTKQTICLNKVGTSTLKVTVSDGQYTDTITWKIKISEVIIETQPEFISWAPTDFDFDTIVNTCYNMYTLAQDEDGDILTYTWTANNQVISTGVDNTNVNYCFNNEGLNTITVKVTDGDNTISLNWNINVQPLVNNKPEFIEWNPTDLTYSTTDNSCINFYALAQDADNDQLTYTWNIDGQDISTGIDKTNTNYCLNYGQNSIKVTVTDGMDSDQLNWIINLETIPNNSPEFIEWTPINLSFDTIQGTCIDFYALAQDQDNDQLTYKWAANNQEIATGIDQTTLNSYCFNSLGQNSIKVTVTDQSATDTLTWNINVIENNTEPVNGAPIIIEHYPFSLFLEKEAKTCQDFEIEAIDPDGDDLTYAWTTDGEVQTVNTDKINICFNDEGTYTITVSVSDQVYTTSLSWTVKTGKTVERTVQSSEIFWSRLNIASQTNLYPGDTLNINVDFENNGKSTLKDVSVSAVIPGIGVYTKKSALTIKTNEQFDQRLLLKIPETAIPGTYVLRVAIQDEDATRVKHRIIRIN